MYRVLIVEDEADAAKTLMDHLQRYGSAHGEKLECVWVKTAEEMLARRQRTDICLLDIDLPEISGMEAAHLLRSVDEQTVIIFVTNLAKFAVKGYEVGALGFIVKPAEYDAVAANLDKAIRAVKQAARDTILVPDEGDAHVVALGTLACIKVQGHHLSYHFADGHTLDVRGSLADLEEQLEGAAFIKVSRDSIANADMVSRINGNDLILTTGEKLRITRGRKREVTERLLSYLGCAS